MRAMRRELPARRNELVYELIHPRRMSDLPTDETMIVTLRVSDLREIIRGVVSEALAVQSKHDLLDLKQVRERYGAGRDSILSAASRGELELSLGPRRKVLVRAGELERWLTETKYVPIRERRSLAKDLEEWDRQAEAELRRMAERPVMRSRHDPHGVDEKINRMLAEGRLRKLSPQEIEEARRRGRRKPK